MPISRNSSYFTRLVNQRYNLSFIFPDDNLGFGDASGEMSALRCHSQKGALVHEHLVRLRRIFLLEKNVTDPDIGFLAYDISFEEECFFLKTTDAEYLGRLRDLYMREILVDNDILAGVTEVLRISLSFKCGLAWSMSHKPVVLLPDGITPYARVGSLGAKVLLDLVLENNAMFWDLMPFSFKTKWFE